MDLSQGRVTPQVEERVAALRLLQLEIAEFGPEGVVFFTGPRYDARSRVSFPGAQFEPASPMLARVVHPDAVPECGLQPHSEMPLLLS